MSASVMGYSPESSRDLSPDTSPYPDRPIRPLPKRRLRERLSPDVVDSIKYPLAPKSSTSLFYHPYHSQEEVGPAGLAESEHPSERERADEVERNYISRRNGDEVESEDEEPAYQSRVYSRHDAPGRLFRYVKPDAKHSNPQPPASTTSSADGYESFENTSNKKKRKIPTHGDLNSGLSSDMAGMGISSDDLVDDVGVISYSSPTSMSGQGISGSGRGRYGRVRNGRSPLRTLSDVSGNWGNGRNTKQKSQWPPSTETPGIISRSIANANANAEKDPITPAQGQENVSLLQQQASKKSSPASTQFTFSCDLQPNWPGPSRALSVNQSPLATRMNTQATQTSPSMPSAQNVPGAYPQDKQSAPASTNQINHQKQAPQAVPQKNRRRTGKEYLIAARQRRTQTGYRNYHHPPALEDIWICEFCEYERIFGTPPEALIKQYEIKDRRQRRQEEERRRLLEKAKTKGRKGKKSNKGAVKSTITNSQSHHAQPPPALSHSQSQGTQSEEYYEDEYDDEYTQDDPPPPSPVAPPPLRDTLHPAAPHHQALQAGIGTENRIRT